MVSHGANSIANVLVLIANRFARNKTRATPLDIARARMDSIRHRKSMRDI